MAVVVGCCRPVQLWCRAVSDLPLLSHKAAAAAADLRILPSADSRTDLALDDAGSLSAAAHVCHVPSSVVHDKPLSAYVPGAACHRTPLLTPSSDVDARPLRCGNSTPVSDDGCQCHSGEWFDSVVSSLLLALR